MRRVPVDDDEVKGGLASMAATQVEGAIDEWIHQAVGHPEEEDARLQLRRHLSVQEENHRIFIVKLIQL